MLGARRHWFMAGTIVVLLSGFGAGIGHAQDAKLLANCAAPQLAAGGRIGGRRRLHRRQQRNRNVSCEVRATDAMTFKSVKAA